MESTEDIKELLTIIMNRYEHMQSWLLKISLDAINMHQLFYTESIRLWEEFHGPGRSDGSLQELKLLHQRYERSAYDKLEIAEQWIERNRSEIERRKNAILQLVEDRDSPQIEKAQQA